MSNSCGKQWNYDDYFEEIFEKIAASVNLHRFGCDQFDIVGIARAADMCIDAVFEQKYKSIIKNPVFSHSSHYFDDFFGSNQI